MKKLILSAAILLAAQSSKSQTTHCDTTHWYTMPVKFTQVSAAMQGDKLNVQFNIEDQTDVVKYVVMVSYDGKTFEPLGEPILPAANKFVYTASFGFK
jgi:hypothetical protein